MLGQDTIWVVRNIWSGLEGGPPVETDGKVLDESGPVESPFGRVQKLLSREPLNAAAVPNSAPPGKVF